MVRRATSERVTEKYLADGMGLDRAELISEGGPIELSADEMDRLTFYDDIANQDDSPKRTFREQLEKMKTDGTEFPCFFATSEY